VNGNRGDAEGRCQMSRPRVVSQIKVGLRNGVGKLDQARRVKEGPKRRLLAALGLDKAPRPAHREALNLKAPRHVGVKLRRRLLRGVAGAVVKDRDASPLPRAQELEGIHARWKSRKLLRAQSKLFG